MSDTASKPCTSDSTIGRAESVSCAARAIPCSVPVASWPAFEDRVVSRRGQARLEVARTATGNGRVAEAEAALEEARMVLGDTAEVVEAIGALAVSRTGDAVAAARRAESHRFIVRLSGAIALLLFGLAATVTSDWLRPRRQGSIPVDAILPQSPMELAIGTTGTTATPQVSGTTGTLSTTERVPQPSPATLIPISHWTEPIARRGAPRPFIVPVPVSSVTTSQRDAVDQVSSVVMRSDSNGIVRVADAAPVHNGAGTEIRRALQHHWQALDGFGSRTLLFDRCDVSVRGRLAVADCTGQASDVRKAGTREPQIEPRLWRFQLTESNGAWRIASVEAGR